jgi:murein DD-endopeptidase MepM/ murein hydrolase activator NlpD
MRIALVFITGWLAGAAIIFASGGGPAPSPAQPSNVDTRARLSSTGNDVMIPVEGVVATSLRDSFNEARAGHMHEALDILAPRGTPVLAAVDGTVRKLFTSGAGGLTIYEFDEPQQRVYYYAHLDRYANIVEGMHVNRGDVIGYVGTTGNAPANTPHLHFAIELLPPTKEWWRGVPINPYPVLKSN